MVLLHSWHGVPTASTAQNTYSSLILSPRFSTPPLQLPPFHRIRTEELAARQLLLRRPSPRHSRPERPVEQVEQVEPVESVKPVQSSCRSFTELLSHSWPTEVTPRCPLNVALRCLLAVPAPQS